MDASEMRRRAIEAKFVEYQVVKGIPGGSGAVMKDRTNQDDDVPIVKGAAGLTGRPQIWREPPMEEELDEDGNPVVRQPAHGQAIPPNCLRVLHSPLPIDRGGGCPPDCAGLQRDGGCLCDIVRKANAQEKEWKFEIDPRDMRWVYIGEPLD